MLIFEKIKGGKAVVADTEKGTFTEYPLEALGSSSVGDAVVLRDGVFVADEEETRRRKQEILKLQNSLWE
ncbi:MAG: DUF3006 domain-containing protein [Huintestinicola sp.]